MDVRLPDGRVVINVPDGTTQAELMARLGLSEKAAPSSNTAVFANALWKGAAAIPDMVLNAPQNVANLGRAAVGTGLTMAGRPDLAPNLNPTADFARRAAEAVGLVNPNIVPQGGPQNAIDLLAQGATAGALTGGGGLAKTLVGGGMGALSAGTAGVTEAATGRPELAAIAGMVAPAAAAKVPALSESAARRLMQSAIKPDARARRTGDAANAVTTNLEHGVSVTKGGVEKLQNKISDLNDQISTRVANSTATVDKRAAANPIQETVGRFSNQVDPHADLAAIDKVLAGFNNHPKLQAGKARLAELMKSASDANSAKVSALQDAGRFQTMGAQQGNLAQGGIVRLSPDQKLNEPYMNVGATGGEARSPSAYPVTGTPRFPERYTENLQRVPEAKSAQADAIAIFRQRRGESDKANQALADFIKGGGEHAIPVQLAQELKQGTYKALGSKSYGELKGADIEAQKALARGLKNEVANAVPEVSGLNKLESALINAKDLTEKRVGASANNNIIGIGALSPSAHNLLAFLLDRWGWSKSLAARGLHSGPGAIPIQENAIQRSAIPLEGVLSEAQKRKSRNALREMAN